MKIYFCGLIIAAQAQIEGSAQEGSPDFNDLETCQKGDIAIECNLDSIKVRKINLASTCSGMSTKFFRHNYLKIELLDGVIGKARNYCPINFTNFTAEIPVSDSW